jgi:hypothetical protein
MLFTVWAMERIVILLRIHEVSSSNLGSETGYPHQFPRGSPQSL